MVLMLLVQATESLATDAGSLQREVPAASKPNAGQKYEPQQPDYKINNGKPKIYVRFFDLVGNQRLKKIEIEDKIKEYEGRSLNIDDLSLVKAKISEAYRERGFLARAVIPEQNIEDGKIRILIIESRLGEIYIQKLDQNVRYPTDRIKYFVRKGQVSGELIRITDLENSISALDAISGIKAAATLQAGKEEGTTDVVVKASGEPLVTGAVRLDNHGSRASGSVRTVGSVNLESPIGQGERITGVLVRSEGLTSKSIQVSYPLLSSGSVIGAGYSLLDYKLSKPLEALRPTGEAEALSVYASLPLYKEKDIAIDLRIDAENNRYINKTINGTTSDKNLKNVSLNLSVDHKNNLLENSSYFARFGPTLGSLDLSKNSEDFAQDAAGPKRDGEFWKLEFDFGWVQPVSRNRQIKLSVTGQKAFKNLDSAQKLSISGPQGVRAYPSNEASGDTALAVQGEYSHFLSRRLQLRAFLDWGWVRVDHKVHTTSGRSSADTPNEFDLKGFGLGAVLAAFKNVEINADLGVSLGDNPALDSGGRDSNGRSGSYQLWLQAVTRF